MNKKVLILSIISSLIGFIFYNYLSEIPKEVKQVKQKFIKNYSGCYFEGISLFDDKNQYYDVDNDTLFYKGNDKGGKIELNIVCSSDVTEIMLPKIFDTQAIILQDNNKQDDVLKFRGQYKWNESGTSEYSITPDNHYSYIKNNSDTGIIEIKGDKIDVILNDEVIGETLSMSIKSDIAPPKLNDIIYDDVNFKDILVNNPIFSVDVNNGSDELIKQSIFEYDKQFKGKLFKQRFMSASDSIILNTPVITDDSSGVASFVLQIEDNNSPDEFISYNGKGSDIYNKVMNVGELNIKHNFQGVSHTQDYLDDYGVRNYAWNLKTTTEEGIIIDNKICDNVNNCLYIPYNDFNIIANLPDRKMSNIAINHDDNSINMILRDKYGNIITPVKAITYYDIDINFSDSNLSKGSIIRLLSSRSNGFSIKDGNDNNLKKLLRVNNAKLTANIDTIDKLSQGILDIYSQESIKSINIVTSSNVDYLGIGEGSIKFDIK